ncbi:uncharacterized protein RhoU [Drosophila virilis]|uniref:Uncharacterized protein n=1 Tax=Drosophila virilis TaxID=7244 RepID=A0A0Q9WL42_DROVI|nr:uncharacterized protein LOC6631317 [Drosophila virilis]XP_032295656.1 uncharacterized protein LOC6631317 [Drosophila virilis]KRF82257.1 uncharacterized protein Dvir_GJ18875 [Drosophila virilis]
MTVKLAKLFGSGSSSKSNSNSASNVPNIVPGHSHAHNLQQPVPPLPPNANMKIIKYCDHHDHHQPAARTIYGNAYECNQMELELEDDYDDNMSLSSAYMQRNHPYNNSQRPLLGERRPQLLLVGGKKKPPATAPMAGIPLPAPPLPPQRSASASASASGTGNVNASINVTGTANANAGVYVSPYVQQQKRDSVKGLHGFNDFDALSQQYNQHLQSPHIGYPYGSPPSPTAQSSDFCFDRQREQEQSFKAISTTSSTATTKSNCSSSSVANGSPPPPPRYGNVGYQDAGHYLDQTQTQLLSHASRFEDDFCTRRNVDFVAGNSAGTGTGTGIGSGTGPFIFGISHEQQQTDYGCRRRCSIDSANSSTTKTNTNSNNNNLNQPVINATPVKEHSALQQSLSDTSADSGKGAKFLLRKRKSKKTTEGTITAGGVGGGVAAAVAVAAAANGEHKAKRGTQPSIKCVLVGDGAVGKTNLILSYLENRFNPEHVPTASDIYNAEVNVNESPVHLTLCDTAGQDTLDPLRELCYPDSDVFLLCFSVVKPETFGAIKSKWAPKFAKTKAALILVGTQADLRSNLNVLNKLQTNGEKPISYADAWDLATTIGAKYIETSSATQDKVKDVFDTAIWEGLVPTTLPPTPSFWKKLFCLA